MPNDRSARSKRRYISATRMSGYAILERSTEPDGEGDEAWYEIAMCSDADTAKRLATLLSQFNPEGPDIG